MKNGFTALTALACVFALSAYSEEGEKKVVKEVASEFKQKFGRFQGDVIESYRLEGADTVVVALGSVVGTLKDVVDELREKGKKIGVLKIHPVKKARVPIRWVKQ